MKRNPIDVTIDILNALKLLGKFRANAEPFDKRTLTRKITDAEVACADEWLAYLTVINNYITVRIAAFVSDVDGTRSDFNFGQDAKKLESMRLTLKVKDLYNELKIALDKGV